ncbi:MAG: hypothetical protein ACOC1K_05800 [Nanoarchaeota archaeon]
MSEKLSTKSREKKIIEVNIKNFEKNRLEEDLTEEIIENKKSRAKPINKGNI